MRVRLAESLATIPELQASAYMLAAPLPPCAHVIPTAVSFDDAMQGGLDTRSFTVQVFVALGLDQAAQIKLDEYLATSGERSVKAAIEANATLTGLVHDLRVSEMSSYNVVTLDGAQAFSADFTVVVYA